MASEVEVLTVLKQAGFVAEAFAEILHEIQPRHFRDEILNR